MTAEDEDEQAGGDLSEDVDGILAEIEQLDVGENEADAVYAAIQAKRKSWKDNRDQKRLNKKDRQYFDKQDRPTSRPE
eukprot:11457172-Alexandrium_andersonii.AAC.1